MCRQNLIGLLVVLVIGGSAPHAPAHRPPIPIEIIGVIKGFDKANQTFTIQTDKPAKMLRIAVGRAKLYERSHTVVERRRAVAASRTTVPWGRR